MTEGIATKRHNAAFGRNQRDLDRMNWINRISEMLMTSVTRSPSIPSIPSILSIL
jgi:hypothetical protein